MQKGLIVLFSLLLIVGCSSTDKRRPAKTSVAEQPEVSEATNIASIDSIMTQQIVCWNAGDIPCYMDAYWHSDSLLFVGKSGINYGWQKTLDNYLKSYSSTAEMGQLHFDNEVMRQVDKETFQVIGKWLLIRNETLGNLQGYYSLLWQIKNGKWVIVSDHSS